jgi:hypothetical protein
MLLGFARQVDGYWEIGPRRSVLPALVESAVNFVISSEVQMCPGLVPESPGWSRTGTGNRGNPWIFINFGCFIPRR